MDEVARALLDRIAASPGGGGSGEADHLVLADHLMQHGQPRWGELVALACAEARGTLTRSQRHRLFLLRGDPGPWLGPVKPVTFRRRFDRGLLVATGLDGRRPGLVAASAGHLAWRTVREVELHEHARWAGHFRAPDEIAAVLRDLPALRTLRGVTMDIVIALAGGAPLPIHTVELFLYRSGDDAMYQGVHAALGGPAFATVREVALGHGIYRDRFEPAELDWWLAEAPITGHAEVLRLGFLPRLEVWRQGLARAARPVLRASSAHSYRGHFELARDAAGTWSRLSAGAALGAGLASPHRLDELEAELAEVPPGSLTAIELRAVPALREEVERRLPRIAALQPGAMIEPIWIAPDPPRR